MGLVPVALPDNVQLTLWMEAAGRGDAWAFRELSRALGPKMYGLAARLVNGNNATAQDVVQEVLIKLWQQAPKWESGGSVSAYVSRLVYTTAMDHHRRHGNETDEMPDVGEEETLTGRVFEGEQRRLLLGALQQLPDRQREALSLAYFHEYRAQDVALAMGTTEKAVESLLVRAKRALAGILPKELKGEAA